MEPWIRGDKVGRGSFGTVDLAIPKSSSRPLMAVKSSDFATSDSLRNEREVLLKIGGACGQIVYCFGDARTSEGGRDLYNLLFEFAAGGSLADRLRVSPGNRLSEFESRQHANSILKGLDFIHRRGFVHCDIKLQNILLFADGRVKIADFGLAKEKAAGESGRFELRGTPLYMSPEVVAGAGVSYPADVWALGCAVVEMVTGNPAWRCGPGSGVGDLLCRIAAGNDLPEIPECLSEEGKDFLSKCFVKDPNERWTARMLLDHPFVSGLGHDEEAVKTSETTSSPRGPFDFPESTPTATDLSEAYYSDEEEYCSASVLKRVDALAGNPVSLPDWSDFVGWVAIR